MHMVSEKDLNSAELENMRTSSSPTTMMTAAPLFFGCGSFFLAPFLFLVVERIKKRRYMSNNWTYSLLLCFFKILPQCFH